MVEIDPKNLNDWLRALQITLAKDYGVMTYSLDALKINFSQRFESGYTVCQVLKMEFGEPKLK